MNELEFERNNLVGIKPKNPFVVRCNLIVLKVAIRKAESAIKEQIGTHITLDNINTGLAYIRDAKTALIIALQDECISEQKLFAVADSLSQAHKRVGIKPVLYCWEQALDFIADMPIPYRVVGNVESESPIGTIIPKKDVAEAETKPVAFDNRLVTGDVKYGGDWHRCIEIARACYEKSLWDGKLKLHICGDIQAMHRHIFFMHEEPFVGRKYAHTYDNNGTLFCYINILDIPAHMLMDGAK